MNYVILKSEVKAFTRTRHGKLEHVRGYTSSRSKRAAEKKEAPKRQFAREAEGKEEEKKTSFREPIGREKKIIYRAPVAVGEKKIIGHTPTGIEKVKKIINDLLASVRKWKRDSGGKLSNAQKTTIKNKLKKIEPQVKDLAKKQRDKRHQAVSRALAKLRDELEDKSKLAERRKTAPLKKQHPGVPLKGLTKQVYEGLIKRGYRREKIRRMGADAAKAAYWNNIKP